MKRILEMVRFGAMPPDDADQPSQQQRKQLVEALDRQVFAASCDLEPKAGKVSARRLNRSEYNHTIRDLFGISIEPANEFPSDEVGAGFDNNGDVLTLSPALMERYLESAEGIASHVIQDPTEWSKINQSVIAKNALIVGDASMDKTDAWFLSSESYGWIDVDVPESGRYMLAIRGGRSLEDKETTPMAIYDDRGMLRGIAPFRYYGGGTKSRPSYRAINLSKGTRRLFFRLGIDSDTGEEIGKSTSQTFAEIDQATVDAAIERRKTGPEKLDQVDVESYPLMVRQFDLRGPIEYASEAFADAHNRIVLRRAVHKRGRWQEVGPAAKECLHAFLRRAFRSPVTDADVDPYVGLVEAAVERGDTYYQGLRVAVTAALVSPRFLFRIEAPPENWPETEGATALTPHQLASRLSYFLWASMPDDELLGLADAGELTSDQIKAQVVRMLADPKADSLATEFAAQWLGLRNLVQHEADTELFKEYTPSLRDAMKRETEMLFADMVRKNRPINELLTCDFTFANKELAEFYGARGIETDSFERISLTELPRRGILSHASVLTLTSNAQRTSPVKRGKWILENIFGTPPPDPPAGVPELDETATANPKASFREQLELHRAAPACASCHRVMDQLGFGLEQFDPIGKYREAERGKPVDSTGELPGGRKFDGAAELSKILASSESENFASAVVERLMTYALGRELSPTDRCTVDDIVNATKKDDHRWIDLIQHVVMTRQFQYYDRKVSGVE